MKFTLQEFRIRREIKRLPALDVDDKRTFPAPGRDCGSKSSLAFRWAAREQSAVRPGLLTAVRVLSLVWISSGAPAAEESDVIGRTNGAYYNLVREGLKGFSCSASNRTIEQLKHAVNKRLPANDPRTATLNSIRFRLSLNGDGEFRFEATGDRETGNPQFDAGLRQTVDGTRNIVLGFCRTWRGFVIEPVFPGAETSYTVKSEPAGYRVAHRTGQTETTVTGVQVLLDRRYRMITTSGSMNNGGYKLTPLFLETPRGFLISGYDLRTSGGVHRTQARIAYQDVGGFKIPASMRMSVRTPEGGQRADIGFSDCTVDTE